CPGPLAGAGHLPQRGRIFDSCPLYNLWREFYTFFVKRGFLIRVTNMIGARISAPSLPGKVDFALQEAKDGRVSLALLLFPLLCFLSGWPLPSRVPCRGGTPSPTGKDF